MLSRRTFLRVLGSAVVGAAVASALPLPVPSTAAPTWQAGTTGPLTYEMLEASYRSCVIGREAPTMMVTSVSIARRLGLIYDVELEEAA